MMVGAIGGETGRDLESLVFAMSLGLGGVSLWCLKKYYARDFVLTTSCSERRSKQYNFFAEIVETSAPAVVLITKHESVQTLFGRGVSASTGSGFIVDENGYVLTNAHVVGNNKRVAVKLQDGRELQGVVTDTDPVTDLALIKLMVAKRREVSQTEFW